MVVAGQSRRSEIVGMTIRPAAPTPAMRHGVRPGGARKTGSKSRRRLRRRNEGESTLTASRPPALPILAMLTLALGVSMTWLDTNIVNIAIPTLMGIFGVSVDQVQWVITV